MYRRHPVSGLDDVLRFTREIGSDPFRFVGFHPRQVVPRLHGRPQRRRGPSIATLLLAGLAVFAFVRLTSLSTRPRRSVGERALIGVLLLAAAWAVMSFRRSGRRYGW
jgi:hypothetical protein